MVTVTHREANIRETHMVSRRIKDMATIENMVVMAVTEILAVSTLKTCLVLEQGQDR